MNRLIGRQSDKEVRFKKMLITSTIGKLREKDTDRLWLDNGHLKQKDAENSYRC